MKVAGIRIGLRGLYWVDCGDLAVRPGDRALMETAEGIRLMGLVAVTPEQLIRPPAACDGRLIQVLHHPKHDSFCQNLPGADMPPLGSHLESESISGTVVQIDAVGRRAAVRNAQGEVEWVALAD